MDRDTQRNLEVLVKEVNKLTGQVAALSCIIKEIDRLPVDKKELILSKLDQAMISPLAKTDIKKGFVEIVEDILG